MRSRFSDPGMWVKACDQAWTVAAKAMLGAIGTEVLGITDIDFVQSLNVAALASFVSLLASVADTPTSN